MTIKEIIENVKELKPCPYSENQLVVWLNDVEGQIALDVHLLTQADVKEYSWEKNQETEPMIPKPHHRIYTLYLIAMIDFHNGEYAKYQNSYQMYNAAYGEYARWYARRYRPADGLLEEKGYYISAYALAVKCGFNGTEEEWLETLKGQQGETGSGIELMGVYETYEALTAAVPEGELGDVYAVEQHLYVWQDGKWSDAGSFQGPKGDKGDMGPQGDTGEKGDKGDTGPAGPQGEKGDTGPAGPQGVQGEKGDKGDTGAKGDKGDTGDTGPEGPRGIQGEQGIPGEIGPQGPQGEKGDTGPRGEKGEKGDKGDTGAGFKVLDYYATLDALKEDIQAPNVGDAYGIGTAEPYDIYIYGETSGWINNGPLQGAKGDTGPQGVQGEKGDTGDTGPQGEKGEDGVSVTHVWNGTTLTITSASGTSSAELKGEKGDTGETGPAGPQGVQGRQGEMGPAGPQGEKGDTGEKGDKGDTGAKGEAGPQGEPGPQGAEGAPGADGADGKSAYQSAREGGYTETESQFYTDLAQVSDKAPAYSYGTEDLTAGTSELETGKLYFVYE